MEMLKADNSEQFVDGGIIGAIIGDVVGSFYEFYNCKSTNIALFTSSTTFTDDTVMTIAVADWLLSGVPLQKTMPDWSIEYPNRGYGECSMNGLFIAKIKNLTIVLEMVQVCA